MRTGVQRITHKLKCQFRSAFCQGRVRSSYLGKVESSSRRSREAGTDRDKPRGAGLVGMVEACQGRTSDTAICGGEDGGDGSLGAITAGGDEGEGRRGGGAWLAW